VVQWAALMQERLNRLSPASVRYELEIARGEEGFDLRVHKLTHGVRQSQRIRQDFFLGPEYRLIGRLADVLFGLVQPGARVVRGTAEQPVQSFREAFDWLMAESRKGRTIQRFKGLGEMNPEQLWETTVNPETRRLLQVTIEDAVAADEIFTTLMGDEVEPRRAFIEQHALDVANLDV
jgi:DNA gyrase subunit B